MPRPGDGSHDYDYRMWACGEGQKAGTGGGAPEAIFTPGRTQHSARHRVASHVDIETISPARAPADVGRLYREHAVDLIRLAMLMVGDAPTAEDVVQDTLLGLHGKRDPLRDPAAALAYLRSAVLNRCRSALRRRAVAGRFRQPYGPPAWSAEDCAMEEHERREVLSAIARLSRRQREVLALHFYCDLPEAEIARTLGISRGTVSAATSRALAALAKILGD